MKQLDMFGNEVEVTENRSVQHKTPTMQEMFGIAEGEICRNCKYHYKVHWNVRKSWHKCELWNKFFRGSSEASDIRVKDQACSKFAKQGEPAWNEHKGYDV